jgi:hypothetical protein
MLSFTVSVPPRRPAGGLGVRLAGPIAFRACDPLIGAVQKIRVCSVDQHSGVMLLDQPRWLEGNNQANTII